MPYAKPSDVPDAVPAAKKAQFMRVWNSAYKKAKADGLDDAAAEKKAFAEAWGVIGKENKMGNPKQEYRSINTEIRAAKSGDGMLRVFGHAAIFNTPTVLTDFMGSFTESIAPGTFSRALREKQDVRCLLNHDRNCVLGRTASETLKLKEDEDGLFFDCNLPDTQLARDVHALVKRGDISGCSFGFKVRTNEWTEDKDGKVSRTLTDVDLSDVSIVTYPAYQEASCEARSVGEVLAAHRAEKKTKKVDGEDLTADCFLYVGDPEKTETWHLPWKFSSEEKTKSHLRNALARFNQTDIPSGEKDAVWKKLVAKCKEYDIKVEGEGKSDEGLLAVLERRIRGAW
jgi:HK97 family phage prohead protease